MPPIIVAGALEDLALFHQTRDVREALVPVAPTAADQAWLIVETYVASHPGRNVSRARLDRGLHRLLVFFVGVVFFRAALPEYLFAGLLVAAAPVVMLAGRITISQRKQGETRG